MNDTKKFDFVFTNHVFEHVFNLTEVFNQMNEYLKPESSMLHFLPCGNEGSYEYNICQLRKDGTNTELENRFFFEDVGHVRRLTTDEFCKLCQTKDFNLQKEFYSNQYYGAIDWITNSNPKFVLMFSDTSQAINKKSKQKLKKVKMYLIFITVLRLPAQIVTKLLRKKNKQLKHYILLLMGILFLCFQAQLISTGKEKPEKNGIQRSLNVMVVKCVCISREVEQKANNHMHSDSKNRRGFRYAPATPVFAAGDVKRWVRAIAS